MIKRLLSYINHLTKYLFISYIFAFIASFGTILELGYLFYILFNLEINYIYIGIFVISIILISAFRFLEQYFGHLVAFKLLSDFRIRVYDKLRKIAPAKMDNKESTMVLSIIHTDIELVEVFFAHTIVPVITAISMTLLMGVLMIYQFGLTGIVAPITYIIVGFIYPFFMKNTISKNSNILNIEKLNLSKLVSDIMNGKKEILEFNLVNKELNKIEKKINREIKISNRNAVIFINKRYIISITILISWFVLFLLNYSSMTNLDKIYLLVYPFTFDTQIALTNLSLSLSKTLKSSKNLISFLDEESLVTDGNENIENINSIEIKNLSFSYPNTNKKVLEDINLNFDSDNIIGIVGKSGEGKTTLVKIIMKWYQTSIGDILINSKDIKRISNSSIRSNINYVPQKTYIFNGTLRENLTLRKNIPDNKIIEKIKQVYLYDKFTTLKDGLDTEMSSEKIPFSSGELQRIELIRALLSESSVMILDEPTSNLDLQNEKIFLEILTNIKNTKIFIISHRKAPIDVCDKVYEVNNGNIRQIK
ncbi:ABC transporter ATP-binding protein [Helcococcus ovis]|uniref:ABC transporter ATP-binding protein n=2 Tax=Helcococcus ovis TaxID=72026 RepID=A0A4R9C579_9FIRM|nr:ABC transporter ATP-binding protein [Helcococcus ovis]TFF64617.1 ABC transporter ATP-binding protein [Helcococcus ovis]TFF66910.1 ABC transporter ATP-binding protein [Helcococcus ovis]TFF67477.1 ABC transporter ATP-binding protein [Helcococcus ovis]WNZ01748.1 ABC transporter ATP-binding protein [Helcococcus ovis]